MIRIQQQQAPSSVNHMGNNSQRGCWEHGAGVRRGCPRAGGHQQQRALLSSRFLRRRGMSGSTAGVRPSPLIFFFAVVRHILYQTGAFGRFFFIAEFSRVSQLEFNPCFSCIQGFLQSLCHTSSEVTFWQG